MINKSNKKQLGISLLTVLVLGIGFFFVTANSANAAKYKEPTATVIATVCWDHDVDKACSSLVDVPISNAEVGLEGFGHPFKQKGGENGVYVFENVPIMQGYIYAWLIMEKGYGGWSMGHSRTLYVSKGINKIDLPFNPTGINF